MMPTQTVPICSSGIVDGLGNVNEAADWVCSNLQQRVATACN